ncbi:MAG: hypothetical protein LBE36_04255 [Flavobacteriaceae bacterium]|nr:hypothetical protein [Flavobacteriaceae bacterium]
MKKYKYKLGDDVNYVYRDMILGERKIIASNGTVEIDRITNFDYEDPEFLGMGINLGNGLQKTITFYPQNMCNKSVELIVTDIGITQMTLQFRYVPSSIDPSCQYYNSVVQGNDLPINFPRGSFTLTKQ